MRGRPHSPGFGALVQEAMRLPWLGEPALAVEKAKTPEREPADPYG